MTPELPVSSDAIGETLSTRLSWAIEQRLVQQELVRPDGTRLRLGVRKTDRGEEFFANYAGTGKPFPVAHQKPRRTKSGLIIKLNELRKLRPAAPLLKPGRLPDLDPNPQTCSFGCLNPAASGSILKRPVLLRIKAPTHEFAVMPQLVPLEPAHVLLVPCEGREQVSFPHLDQVLTEQLLEEMVEIAAALQDWTLVFNSMHAGATVRHFHLQAVGLSEPLPVERAGTVQRAGWPLLDKFPARGIMFDEAQRPKLIDAALALQKRSLPFNVLARGRKIFLFGRNPDQEIIDIFPHTRFAAMEMAGVIYTSSQEAFDGATDETITTALTRTTLTAEELLEVLGIR